MIGATFFYLQPVEVRLTKMYRPNVSMVLNTVFYFPFYGPFCGVTNQLTHALITFLNVVSSVSY